MERLINEQIDVDANPLMLCALGAQSAACAIELHAALNQRANFALRTFVALGSDGALRISQRGASPEGDLAICRDTHLAAFAVVISRVGRAASRAGRMPLTLSSLSAKLGLERSAARDAALALEEDPGLKVGSLAKLLGANARALERWLRIEGLTPMAIKRASMLIRATTLLRGDMSLTGIAHESGYADLAHMSRAFASSCALTPTQLRACVGGGPRDATSAKPRLSAPSALLLQ